MELLVSAGFDVNALGRSDIPGNQPWHTALHVAAEKGDLALAQTLQGLGADPDIPDKHYQSTPVGWARYFDQPAIVDLLEAVTHRRSQTALTPGSPFWTLYLQALSLLFKCATSAEGEVVV